MGYIDQLIESYGYAAVFIVLALGLFSLPIPDEVMVRTTCRLFYENRAVTL